MQTVQKGLLANPPLGTRPQGSVEVAVNRPEFVKTSDNQVIFFTAYHVYCKERRTCWSGASR